jgi:hypothetical protein
MSAHDSLPWWVWLILLPVFSLAGLVAPVAFAILLTKAEEWAGKRKQLTMAAFVFVVFLTLLWLLFFGW